MCEIGPCCWSEVTRGRRQVGGKEKKPKLCRIFEKKMSHHELREGRVDSVSPVLGIQRWITEQDLILQEHRAAVRAPKCRVKEGEWESFAGGMSREGMGCCGHWVSVPASSRLPFLSLQCHPPLPRSPAALPCATPASAAAPTELTPGPPKPQSETKTYFSKP